jgi:membrane protease YdiL (CAAX protease family)
VSAGAAAAAGPPVSRRGPYPRFGQAIGLLAIAIVAQTVVGIGLTLLRFPGGVLAMGVGNLVAFGPAVWVATRKAKVPLASLVSRGKTPPCLFVWVALGCLGLSIVVSEVDNLFSRVLPVNDFWAGTLYGVFFGEGFFGTFFALVLVAPLTEELLFRRIILDGFLRNYGVPVAIALSSLLFGIVHLNPWQFVGATIVGVYLAWLYLRSRSVLLCMFAHGVFNFLPLLLLRILNLTIPGYSTPSVGALSAAPLQPLWLDVLGLAALAAGVLLSHRVLGPRPIWRVPAEASSETPLPSPPAVGPEAPSSSSGSPDAASSSGSSPAG